MANRIEFEMDNPERDAWHFARLTSHKNTLLRGNIRKEHPDLEKALIGIEDDDARADKIREYVDDFYSRHSSDMSTSITVFQGWWDPVNDAYMGAVADVLETDWAPPSGVVRGFVSMVPVNPRYLKVGAFSVYWKSDQDELRHIAGHETLHFHYFNKWKDVFPGSDELTFEHPHPIWVLSELLAPVLMNDERVASIIGQSWPSYLTRLRELEGELGGMYAESRARGQSMGGFLEDCYKKIMAREGQLRGL